VLGFVDQAERGEGGMTRDIFCHRCESWCGKSYPDTRIDPGFDEGPGENFTDEDGNWHCSQACLNETKAAAESDEDLEEAA
jgi:hypothetical protein